MHFLHFAIAALAAMSMIGAVAGADDTTTSHPRASVITRDATVVDGVPVPTRKLIKNSKASKPDAAEDTIARLVRSLVFFKMMDVSRSLQPSSSSEDVAAGADKNDGRRELTDQDDSKTVKEKIYEQMSWNDCLNFYEGLKNPESEALFCRDLTPIFGKYFAYMWRGIPPFIAENYVLADIERAVDSCNEIVQCPSTTVDERGYLLRNTPSSCCANEGLSPPVLPPGQAGDSCDSNSDCLPLRGSDPPRRALCRAGRCQSGFSNSFCDENLDCLPVANLSPPHGVCQLGFCRSGRTGEYCGQGNDCVSGICRANKPNYPKKCIQK